MASAFDNLFAAVDALAGEHFGEAVEYTFLDGHTVTDSAAFVDFVDAEGQASTPEHGDRGVEYKGRREFGLRKSVVPAPEIHATIRVVSEGDNADVWTIAEQTGADAARTYLLCERRESHERSRPSYRNQ